MNAPPAGSALRLDGLSVQLGDAPVLRELSLELAAGGRLAVVGRSGAGKTTLLRAIAGLCPLSAGAIEVAGQTCAQGGEQRVAPAAREVGLVFQDLGLWEHLTVAETLAFAGRGSRAERREKAGELAVSVGLGERLRAFPGELSGGEQQRLALARALASEPRLLLLDEPFSHLDPPLRRELSALVLERAAQRGLGLVVASHALEDVLRLGERLCVLESGRAVESGSVTDSLSEPRSEALVRLFDLGSVLEGTVRAGRFTCELGEVECAGAEGARKVWAPPEGVVARDGGVAATVVGSAASNGRVVRELRTAAGARLLSTLEAEAGSAVEVALVAPLRVLDGAP